MHASRKLFNKPEILYLCWLASQLKVVKCMSHIILSAWDKENAFVAICANLSTKYQMAGQTRLDYALACAFLFFHCL